MTPTYRMHETPDGVDLDCDCGEVMHFTKHTTVGHMQAAKNEHAKTHEGRTVLTKLDARFYSLDNTNAYIEFMSDKIQLGLPALNRIAGRAGAWVWKFDGPDDNAAHLERVLQRHCEVEAEKRETGKATPRPTITMIPDDPTTEIEVGVAV